jgi:ribonucleotide monophosphatase NagD (HAD superfamily)
VEDGEFYPGCGALVEAVSAVAGVRPEVAGKPMPHIFREAIRRAEAAPEDTVMIGDSLISDVRGAQSAGLRTIWLAPPGTVSPEGQADLAILTFAELLGRL